ncbi:cytochrome c family protein, partial [Oleiphilus sp. HI0123]
HSTDASGKASVGPNLRGKYGQPAASASNFNYSSGLSESNLTWNEANLDRFLEDPAGTVPGTTMGFGGIKDPNERNAIIEALRALK